MPEHIAIKIGTDEVFELSMEEARSLYSTLYHVFSADWSERTVAATSEWTIHKEGSKIFITRR